MSPGRRLGPGEGSREQLKEIARFSEVVVGSGPRSPVSPNGVPERLIEPRAAIESSLDCRPWTVRRPASLWWEPACPLSGGP